MTSRHKKYDDPRVWIILPKTPWKKIREGYWYLEGADSREELQQVIEDIYGRKVLDDELFYPHIGDFREE